jgi:hypothetical protein
MGVALAQKGEDANDDAGVQAAEDTEAEKQRGGEHVQASPFVYNNASEASPFLPRLSFTGPRRVSLRFPP